MLVELAESVYLDPRNRRKLLEWLRAVRVCQQCQAARPIEAFEIAYEACRACQPKWAKRYERRGA